MAILKKSALKEMSTVQLQSKITELENEVQAELVAKTTAGKPSNPGRARTLRKTIARIKTMLTAKGASEPAKQPVAKPGRRQAASGGKYGRRPYRPSPVPSSKPTNKAASPKQQVASVQRAKAPSA